MAVNVDPFPGQLIGAKIPGTEGWRFPIRTATRHTTYLDPEKAMIYADPRSRKAAILLRDLSPNVDVWVHVAVAQKFGVEYTTGSARFPGTWRRLDEQTNTLELVLRTQEDPAVQVHAPLEDARAVWTDEGRRALRLAGTVQIVKVAINVEAVVFYSPGA